MNTKKINVAQLNQLEGQLNTKRNRRENYTISESCLS